jgi:hypothetical protein
MWADRVKYLRKSALCIADEQASLATPAISNNDQLLGEGRRLSNGCTR